MPQSWPAALNRSGGTPMDIPERQVLLPVPRVEAAGVDADGHVGDAPRPAPRRARAAGRGTTAPRRGRRARGGSPRVNRRSAVPRGERIGSGQRTPARAVAARREDRRPPSAPRGSPWAARHASNAAAVEGATAPRRAPAPRIFRRQHPTAVDDRVRIEGQPPRELAGSDGSAPGTSAMHRCERVRTSGACSGSTGSAPGPAVGLSARRAGWWPRTPRRPTLPTPRARRRSRRSPIPHDVRERVVGSWTAQPQARRSAGRWQAPGPLSRASLTPSSPASAVIAERDVAGQRVEAPEVGPVLEAHLAANGQARPGTHDRRPASTSVGSPDGRQRRGPCARARP